MRTLILGGARSGKSALAERLAAATGREVAYIATAEARDPEMARRIAHHRARRPANWVTVEEPIQLARALRAHDAHARCLLVDCLTLWLNNLLQHPDPACPARERDGFLNVLQRLEGDVILVSNEVGSGIVPMGELSRHFVDESGRLHQAIAARCERVLLVVAGLQLALKGELP